MSLKKSNKFISIIWGYHKQIFSFEKDQNYHMMPFEIMKEQGYECELFAIDSQVKIESDPNFINGIKVIYYKNIFQYLLYLFKNRYSIIYSNSLTIKTLLVGLLGKKTFFCPHSFPLGHNKIKTLIIKLFYRFFSKIRINNYYEFKKINQIKKGLAYICPLAISDKFLNKNLENRKGGIWIGNLTDIKNPEFLLDACESLKRKNIIFSINIIGEDRYNKNGMNFSDLIIDRKLEKYIKFLGFKSHSEIKYLLSKSSIYINTSISEGQCLAVYEGVLSGNALCLQNIISFPSVFGKNALYHNTPNDLANNIIYLINNKDKVNKIIKENQNMILEKYNYNYIKNRFKNMILG